MSFAQEDMYNEFKGRLLAEIGVDMPNSSRLGRLINAPKRRPQPQEGLRMSNTSVSCIHLKSKVDPDEVTESISKMFDYDFNGETVFRCEHPAFPEDYGIGLIVGPSGSGKSTLLNEIGLTELPRWERNKAVASHFDGAEEAQSSLSGVGFNSIPSWMRPYHVLSTGEKFRADMARTIKTDACIDEFTSVVDRTVAKSCAYAVARLIADEKYRRVTFASCHYDIIEWLQPDWVYDTIGKKFLSRGAHRLPDRVMELYPCNTDCWPMFRDHHYLTENINKGARCWIAMWEGQPVGFASAIAFPNAHWKNGWREHRTVCLADYQGLGLGVRISDAVAQMFLNDGARYFSKTAHPRMGEYRNRSPLWRATSKNGRARPDYDHNRKTKESTHKHLHMERVTYSHEYMGRATETPNRYGE